MTGHYTGRLNYGFVAVLAIMLSWLVFRETKINLSNEINESLLYF